MAKAKQRSPCDNIEITVYIDRKIIIIEYKWELERAIKENRPSNRKIN